MFLSVGMTLKKIFFPFLLGITVCILLHMLTWKDMTQHINFRFLLTSPIDWLTIDNLSVLSEHNSSRPSRPPSTTRKEIITDPTQRPVSLDQETVMPPLHKTDYKKLPEWDFDDTYIQDAHPKQTNCQQSLWNAEESISKLGFISNIRLFMHDGHLTVREWNRLSHFNNPYGFMDYFYKDVKAAVDLIPKPKEPLLLPRGPDGCVHCAVVGTGGILNGSGMGKEIDAHDHVFRMNGAITTGYEEDVGNKTTVYVHTAHSITSSPQIFRKYGFKNIPHDEGIKYVMIPEGLRDYQWLLGLLNGTRISEGPYQGIRPWLYYKGQFERSRFYVLHPDFLRYVRNRFLRSKTLDDLNYWSIYRPTNGAFTIFLALHTCDVVDVYGFMTEDWKKYPNYYFERHEKTRVIFYANHDYMLEMTTWKNLHNAKILKLHQRKD